MSNEQEEKKVEPIAMKAGDPRVLINGLPCKVDFRVIAEHDYTSLLREVEELKAENEKNIKEIIEMTSLLASRAKRWESRLAESEALNGELVERIKILESGAK